MNDPLERAYEAGQALADRGRDEEALVRFGQALTIDPGHRPTWQQVAMSRMRLDDYPGMLAAADEVVGLAPEAAQGHLLRAIALRRLGRSAEALDSAREAVRLDPIWSWAMRELASALLDAGDHDAALATAHRACELDPADQHVWFIAAKLTLRRGDAVEAERLYRHAVSLDPGDFYAVSGLADAVGGQYRFAEAVELTKQALPLAKASERASVLGSLALWLKWARRRDEAADLLRTAVEAFPTHPKFRADLVNLLRDDGRDTEALAVARAAVVAVPDSPRCWSALASVLPAGDPDRLLAARRATELGPQIPWSWLVLSDELRIHGDTTGAVATLTQVGATARGEYTVQIDVAQRLRELGEPALALTHADQAVALAPSKATTHLERGAALRALGRYAEAQAAADRAAELEEPDVH